MATTIANGATTSNAIQSTGLLITGIRFPAAFTGTAVTFTESKTDAGTFNAVTDGGSAISYTVAAGQTLMLPRGVLAGLQWVKVVSNAAEAAARELEIISIRLYD